MDLDEGKKWMQQLEPRSTLTDLIFLGKPICAIPNFSVGQTNSANMPTDSAKIETLGVAVTNNMLLLKHLTSYDIRRTSHGSH